MPTQARRQGGSREFMRTPLLTPKDFIYTSNILGYFGAWGYFGAQNVITIHCFCPGMVTKFWFTSHLAAWRLVSISGFNPPWNRVRSDARMTCTNTTVQRAPETWEWTDFECGGHTFYFKYWYTTIWKWSTSLAAVDDHCCPVWLQLEYASSFMRDQRGTCV